MLVSKWKGLSATNQHHICYHQLLERDKTQGEQQGGQPQEGALVSILFKSHSSIGAQYRCHQ